MTSRSGQRAAGFTLFEFAVCAAMVAVLVGLFLMRVVVYQEEAERVAVQQLLGSLRTALQLRASEVAAREGENGLRRLREENPLELLVRKPANYVGEFYAPDLEKIPSGNWLFDRRDKCLIYLFNSHKSFYLNASKLIRFKVEFAELRRQAAGQNNGPAEVLKGLVLNQVSDGASARRSIANETASSATNHHQVFGEP